MDHPPRSNLFPVLKNATILQIFNEEVNVPLTEAELTEPGRCKERVREVFVQLLHICWGLADGALQSLPPRLRAAQAALAHPSLYDDALPEAKFFCLTAKLLRICGYYDFGFRDLAAPTAKRLRRQLSAVINFLKYREDMGHLAAQALEEREDLFSALDEVAENNLALNDQLEEARALNHENMLERQEAEVECKEMEAEIAQQNKIQSSIRQETYLLKNSAKELKDQIANLSIALREIQAEERQLSKEVVHSPERIKEDLAKASNTLESVKKDIVETQRETTLVQKQMEHASLAEESFKEIMVGMEEMETKVQEYELVVEESSVAEKKLEAMGCSLEEKRREREEQNRQLEALETHKSETIAALTSALRSARDELASAVGRLGLVESERREGMARIEACETRVEELKSLVERGRRQAEEEIAQRIASFQRLEKAYWEKEDCLTAQLERSG